MSLWQVVGDLLRGSARHHDLGNLVSLAIGPRDSLGRAALRPPRSAPRVPFCPRLVFPVGRDNLEQACDLCYFLAGALVGVPDALWLVLDSVIASNMRPVITSPGSDDGRDTAREGLAGGLSGVGYAWPRTRLMQVGREVPAPNAGRGPASHGWA